jgi:hypothetical protein
VNNSEEDCDFHCIHCGEGDYFEVGFILSCRHCGKYPFKDNNPPPPTDDQIEESEASWQMSFIKPTMLKKMLDRLIDLGEITPVYHPEMELYTYYWTKTKEPLCVDLE